MNNDHIQIINSLEIACKEKDEYMKIIQMEKDKQREIWGNDNRMYYEELNHEDDIHKVYESEFEKTKQLYVK